MKACGLLTLLAATFLLRECCCLPIIIVNSGKPKCFTVEASRNTKVQVHYEAPDLDMDGEAKGPTYITVTEKPSKSLLEVAGEIGDLTNRKHRNKPNRRGALPQPISQELDSTSGVIDYKVHHDGQVNVCIRASTAGSKNPMRFGLRVAEEGDESADMAEQGKKKDTRNVDVNRHLGFLEKQLDHLKVNLGAVRHDSEFFEQQDGIFHQQNIKMNSASLYWPIIHVGILLITGFTQARHIIYFFKSRRII